MTGRDRGGNPVVAGLAGERAAQLVIVMAIAFLLLRAWLRAAFFDGEPSNGAFQLLDMLDRLHAGQVPWRDFVVFHGIGVNAAHLPVYWLFGSNLFGSELARQTVTSVAWVGAMAWLVAAVGNLRRVPLHVIALLCGLSCLSNVELSRYGINNPIVSQPGGSLLALRWAWPAACGALLVQALQQQRWRSGPLALAAALFALAPLWSFEQGVYAAAAGLLTVGAAVGLQPAADRQWSAPLLFLAVLVPVAAAGFAVATGGDPIGLARFVFSVIPQNQGWFFGVPPNASLAVHGADKVVVAWVVALVVLALAWRAPAWWPALPIDRSRWRVGVLFIGGYAALAGTSLAGYLHAAYVSPAFNGLMVLAVVAVLAAVQGGPALVRPWRAGVVLLAASGVVGAVLTQLPAAREALAHARGGSGWTVSGTHPTGRYTSMQPMFERIGRAGDRSLLGTYRGLLDLGFGQPPNGRIDLIIHALGPAERAAFMRTFEQGDFAFVHTMRGDTRWKYEEWLQGAFPDFYRGLVARYRIVERSDFGLLWERRPAPLATPAPACRTLAPPAADGRWPLDGLAAGFHVLHIDYRVDNPLAGIPVLGSLPRFLVGSDGLGNRLPLALDPAAQSADWIVHHPGGTAGLSPRAWTVLPGATLQVGAVRACPLDLPADVLPAFAHLLPGFVRPER